MPGYPLFLKLEGKRCLVFGGGEVAFRKVKTLLKSGARVLCVSKEFSEPLRKLARKSGSQLTLRRGTKAAGFEPAPALVVAATSDRKFNARVAEACRKKRIWVNVADDPALCDFYAPAVFERGPLQIAISTGGASPLFAKKLREALEQAIPASTGKLLKKLERIRNQTIREKVI
jgi:siroheme synthase-like protein